MVCSVNEGEKDCMECGLTEDIPLEYQRFLDGMNLMKSHAAIEPIPVRRGIHFCPEWALLGHGHGSVWEGWFSRRTVLCRKRDRYCVRL